MLTLTAEEATPPVVKYEGGFENGAKSGLGQMWYPNGDRYHGLWANGKKNGDGTFYYANGDIYRYGAPLQTSIAQP